MIKLKSILSARQKMFNFPYTISLTNHKTDLENKIYGHFKNYYINYEDENEFFEDFKDTFLEKLEYFNQLYFLLDEDLFKEFEENYTSTEKEKIQKTNKTNTNKTDTFQNDNEFQSKETGKGDTRNQSVNRHADYAQGRTEISDSKYITNLDDFDNKDTVNSNVSNDGTQKNKGSNVEVGETNKTGNDERDVTKTSKLTRNVTPNFEKYLKFQKSYVDVDAKFIRWLSQCFVLIFNEVKDDEYF